MARSLARCLALPLALALAAPALAQDGRAEVRAELVRRAGLTTVTLEGRLPAGAAGAVTGRLTRPDAPAAEPVGLELSGAVEADGRYTIRLRTARLLLPGAYLLELTAPRATQLAVRLGTPEETAAAEARLLAWYRNAARALRDLSAALERRGRFHAALARADEEGGAAQRRAFTLEFLSGWQLGLRRARMDLATYRRRVTLPPRAAAGDDLGALPALLAGRAEAWTAAVERGEAPLGPPAEVLAVAKRLLERLGRSPAEASAGLADWQANDLAEPPPSATPGGRHEDPLGFALAIPAEAEVLPARAPADRLTLALAGARAVVRVQDFPDDVTPDALARRLEVGAWESWEEYKRLASERLGEAGERGLRLELTARLPAFGERTARYETARVVQRALFVPGGRRVVSLLLLWPEDAAPPPALSALEGSFELVERR